MPAEAKTAVAHALEELEREGLIVGTNRWRWSERKREWQRVYASAEAFNQETDATPYPVFEGRGGTNS